MFQYAMGRTLAASNGMNLVLDASSGFVRDKVFRRSFSLSEFSVNGELRRAPGQLPFWIEQLRQKARLNWNTSGIRPWGRYICEQELIDHSKVMSTRLTSDTWIEGYWQSEQYFLRNRTEIGAELTPPTPKSAKFLGLAREIAAAESVAVGVRLFEEVPGADKAGVGGLVPFSFYRDAAEELLSTNTFRPPTFFVFCTRLQPMEDKIKLPGKVVFVTHENGFEGQNDRLWLISRCKHHIISNSSFYWWGAWLAECSGHSGQIIAADSFANADTIPHRWRKRTV